MKYACLLLIVGFSLSCSAQNDEEGFFVNYSDLLVFNPPQLNYGIAILDVDADGQLDAFVAGHGYPNLIFHWRKGEYGFKSHLSLLDPEREAIGVAAGDIDGDGREEIYVLNTDAYSGAKQFADRLFDWRDSTWVDLFELPENQDVLNKTAGRSVAAVDPDGDGRYGFYVANYGGAMRFYELEDSGQLIDSAPQKGLAKTTGGRSVLALPFFDDSRGIDIFAANERGANFFFRNRGNGTYSDIALQLGIDDLNENGRGVDALDANGDGRWDIIYGNWEGPHRLFIQQPNGTFENIAEGNLAQPSRIRTVIAADFDNDGYEELFFNNIGQPNQLFRLRDGEWISIDIGDAFERKGLGTGAAVGDLDEDGVLELFVSHGELGGQPVSLYKAAAATGRNYLRVQPLTPQGAPARNATVTLLAGGRRQLKHIDGGSGYLCQMEPYAHFGLAQTTVVDYIEIRWPDGKLQRIDAPAINQVMRIPHP